MKLGFVIAGVLVAGYGVLLWMDKRRVATYLERQRILGIIGFGKARRMTAVLAVLFVLAGLLLLGLGL